MAEKDEVPGLGGTWARLFFMLAAISLAGVMVWGALFALEITNVSPLAAVGFGGGFEEQDAPSGGATNQLPDCGNQQPVAGLATFYYDPNNNNQYTQVSTNAYLYQAGAPVPASTVVTKTSGVNSTTAGELSCGASYREIAGDGGGTAYYYAKTGDFQVNNAVMPLANTGLGIEVISSGASTNYIKGPTTNYNTTMGYNITGGGTSAGGTDSGNLFLKVQAPSCPSMMGDLGFAVCFRYNSNNFTQITAEGGTAVGIAHFKATSALDTISCYEFAALPCSSNKEIPVTLKTASGLSSGTVDVSVVDKSNELYNGYLIPTENSAAGVSANGYDLLNTPNTGTGRADVTTTGVLRFTSDVV